MQWNRVVLGQSKATSINEIGSWGWTIHEFKQESMTNVLIIEVIDACKFQDYDIDMLEMLWLSVSLRILLFRILVIVVVLGGLIEEEDVFFGESRRRFSSKTTLFSDEITLGIRSLWFLVRHSSKS